MEGQTIAFCQQGEGPTAASTLWPDCEPVTLLTKPQGSPADVRRMTRVQRLASAVTFLLWGCAFLGLQAATAFLTSRLGLLSPDNPLVQAVMYATTFLAGGGLLGGIYLLVRVLV